MPEQRIIYPTSEPDSDGNVSIAVIIPTPEALAEYGIEAIAQKDTPPGVPYKIVETTDLPENRTFRSAWEVELSTIDDGVGSETSVFEPQAEQEEQA